jgi:LPS O-antigen subunit length determinant protein (WzzB/FepE family)
MEETEQRPVSETDEINLMEYFQVIWQRKSLIIGIFFIAVIAAAIISYTSPPVYRVTASVSPGWIAIDAGGKAIFLDSAENLKALIESEAFNPSIIRTLKLDPVKYSRIEFKTKLSKNTEALSVSYDSIDIAQGKFILGELLKHLTDYYKNRTNSRTETIGTSINILKNKSLTEENKKTRILNEKRKIISNMELLKDKEKLLKITEKYLTNQLKGVEENTKNIMDERSAMLKKGEKVDSVALLLYSNTIQQNISYIDRLNADLEKNRLDQDKTKNELSGNEIELRNKDTELKDVDAETSNNLEEIQKLEITKMNVEGLKIIQEPYAFPRPVGPRKLRNMAIAGVTSLFFGIFLVFFLEFIKKARQTTDRKE